MSNEMLRFPSAEVMTTFLSNHVLLDLDYYKEKKITQTIVKLAAERFANSKKSGIQDGAVLIVHDLHRGKDGFTGAKLPKIELSDRSWAILSIAIEKALVDCAGIQSKL